jgi:hypothetical protein
MRDALQELCQCAKTTYALKAQYQVYILSGMLSRTIIEFIFMEKLQLLWKKSSNHCSS